MDDACNMQRALRAPDLCRQRGVDVEREGVIIKEPSLIKLQEKRQNIHTTLPLPAMTRRTSQ